MEEIMKCLEAAFKATSIIPVTGDAVDSLAVVRSNLRKAYAEAEKIDTENKEKMRTPLLNILPFQEPDH